MNRMLTTALTGIGVAQLLKLPIHYAKTGEWKLNILLENGRMPSSHSAGVSALAVYAALKRGISSVDFAISAMFGLIVMYDAMGVRRHTGEIAVEVNDLKAKVERLAGLHPGVYHQRKGKMLTEMIGHLPREVVGGCLVGAAVGAISYFTAKQK